MKRGFWLGAALVAGMLAMAVGCTEVQTPPQTQRAQKQTPESAAPDALVGPGWTGLTEPAEIIEARKGLMDEAERLIKPIDLFTIGEPADIEELRSAAVTISRLLLAVPHLFPPTTDLHDPTVLESATNALPALWQDFDTFFELAEAAETAATTMTAASDAEGMRVAARNLRASCDACHALYLKAYVPPTSKPEDFEFDFDSVLPKN
jgi:cytochrome c556